MDRGVLRFCYGGAAQGAHLTGHPGVDSVHLTGSADTFDAIVWGPGNKEKKGEPVLKKPVHAELGNVVSAGHMRTCGGLLSLFRRFFGLLTVASGS